jgi:hypothetical protein
VRKTRPAAVITDAPRSPAAELHSRQTRYIIMMLARAGFLVLAAVLAMLRVPWPGLWVAVCLVGALLLPWLAVVLANDGAPKPEHRLGRRFHRVAEPPAPLPRTLTGRPEPTVIDVEP